MRNPHEKNREQEREAEIRNKLTMPLTVLNNFMAGKNIPKKNVKIAIRELEEILKMMKGDVGKSKSSRQSLMAPYRKFNKE